MHEFFYSKGNQQYAKYHIHTVEKMETVPDEEAEKREQLMYHIFGEVIVFCFLQNDCAMIYKFLFTKEYVTKFTDEISKKLIIT